jgi:acetolactate synthase I/II/III large subunit
LSAKIVSVADHLWSVLGQLNIKTVFGLPGTTILDALESLRAGNQLRFVSARHEQCAGHMADASARLSAPFGVVLVDLGPGLANTATAVLAAARDSIPLFVVAGNEERELIGREVWHEMPELEVFGSLLKSARRLERARDFPRLLRESITTCAGGRPGPVLLSVPKDLWNEPISAVGEPSVRFPALPCASKPALEAAVKLIRTSARPLIVAGGGMRRSSNSSLVAFCEKFNIPVVTSPNGRGCIPEDHPLCLGHAGRFGQKQASQALADADLLLVLGSRLSDLATHNWSLLSNGQMVVHVDVEAEMLGRQWPVNEGIISDASLFLNTLMPLLNADGWNIWNCAERSASRQKERNLFYAIQDDILVKPQAVMRALERKVDSDHTIIMGGGRFQQFVGEWQVRSPMNFFYAANSGVVGFALSAAIGAAIEHPARTTLCCLGDGDFMMHVQEIETAVRTPISSALFSMTLHLER